MASFRVFKLATSADENEPACWHDQGVTDLDGPTTEAVQAAFGSGEFLVLDETCVTIVDVADVGA